MSQYESPQEWFIDTNTFYLLKYLQGKTCLSKCDEILRPGKKCLSKSDEILRKNFIYSLLNDSSRGYIRHTEPWIFRNNFTCWNYIISLSTCIINGVTRTKAWTIELLDISERILLPTDFYLCELFPHKLSEIAHEAKVYRFDICPGHFLLSWD